MYTRIMDFINEGNYTEAGELLSGCDLENCDETLAVLAATIFFETGNLAGAERMVHKGLALNPENYELYLILGQIYLNSNVNQAFLCFENAEFFCTDENDKQIIIEFKEHAAANPLCKVNKTAFVILSYNDCELLMGCIESIRKYNLPSSYEIIVVDNASTDSSVAWLKEQKDIKLLCNTENKGFPEGCNQGVKLSSPEADILFLNSDTVVYQNSIFHLRMCLYSDAAVGAAGSVTNYAGNRQMVKCSCTTDDEYESLAREINSNWEQRYSVRLFLIGFAMLVKRRVLDEIGLFDVRFSPGQYEDEDMGLRICQAGYRCVLCNNSFIRHYGGGNGKNAAVWKSVFWRNEKYLHEKWGFEVKYYTHIRTGLISYIDRNRDEEFSVLEVGCGLGGTLGEIQTLYPKARVHGIEIVSRVADIGKKLYDIIEGNIETMQLPYRPRQFDYIIFGDVLEHLRDPEGTLRRLDAFLAEDGYFICSIPNIMNVSVLEPLLRGEFHYEDAGILDRTHLRFFTMTSIIDMFNNIGYTIENMDCSTSGLEKDPKYQEFVKWITGREDSAHEIQYWAYQYVFCARRNS